MAGCCCGDVEVVVVDVVVVVAFVVVDVKLVIIDEDRLHNCLVK